MLIHTRVLAALVAATLLLALATNSAGALRSLNLEGGVTQVLTGRITLEDTAIDIICEVTVEKTLSRSIPKLEGVLMGRITSISSRACRANIGTIRRVVFLIGAGETGELWRLYYKSFLGTLPTISGYKMRAENVQILIEHQIAEINSCLYEGPVELLEAIEAGGNIARLRTTEEAPATITMRLLQRLTGICNSTGKLFADLRPTGAFRYRLV